MALLIISPYIGEGERKVLLALSKVFHIAYCDFFDPTEANAWQQICIDFVYSVRTFMPKLLHKQKVRYLLHLVERMKNYGSSSTFSAELQLPTMVHSMHSRSIVLQRMELEQQDPPFGVIVHMGVMDGDIHQYRAVVSQSSELVHSGDYVKLHPSFCQFRATIKPKSEHTLCLVQGFETFKLSNGTAMLEQR
eukprot:Em0015g700a